MFHGFEDSLVLKLMQHQVDCPHGTSQSSNGILFQYCLKKSLFILLRWKQRLSSIMAISKGCWFKNAFGSVLPTWEAKEMRYPVGLI